MLRIDIEGNVEGGDRPRGLKITVPRVGRRRRRRGEAIVDEGKDLEEEEDGAFHRKSE